MTHELTRREVLALAGGGALALTLTACSGRRGSINGTPSTGGSFAQPEVLASADGRLAVTLTASARQVPWGSGSRYAYTYNGSTPGPTLRVRPGDQLVVTLQNDLDHDTNLHTHGLHVSPSDGADNIFVMVPAGGSHVYTYDIPADHRSGTFWYHPHVHGRVAEQVAAGLAGAIVVTDAIDDGPELATATERVMVLSDPPIGTTSAVLRVTTMATMQGRQGDQVLVNGVRQPTLAARAGTLEHWRVVNASAARYYQLAVDGHQLHAIASDGGRLAAPATVDHLLLAPGERAEVLVAPTATGTYTLRSLAYDRGRTTMGGGMTGGTSMSSESTIASLAVTGSAAAAPLPTALAPTGSVATGAPSSTRTVTLAMGGSGSGGVMGGGGMMGFTIDGRTFDGTRTDMTAHTGTVEEWVLRNTSPMDHPFHLHVWPFLVVDGPPTAGWKDTVNVPASGEVRVRVAFRDLTGRTVYHCHILDHEDLGMMGTIEVTG